MTRSAFAPVMSGPAFDRLDYVFVGPPLGLVLLMLLASASLVAVALVLHTRLARRFGLDAPPGSWTIPLGLGLAAVIPVALLPWAPASVTAVAAYAFVDLRWWWGALLLAAALWRFDREIGAPGARAIEAAGRRALRPRFALEIGVAMVVMLWATATTPLLRFDPALHGDEVKYLRYAETWVQGHGLGIGRNQPLAEVPLRLSAVARNVVHAGRAAGEEVVSLASDLRAFAAEPSSFKWMRATGGEWFLAGKRGDVYQVHQPALSVILFPGYLIDRWLTGTEAGYRGQLPAAVPATNATMLLLFGAWAAVSARVAGRVAWSRPAGACLALIAFASIPVAPFAFQIYPESAAGLALMLVINFMLGARAQQPARARAFRYGLLAALLPWLHIRFLLLAFVLAVAVLSAVDRRARRPFVFGFLLPLVALSLYAYRLTGSLLPWAHWSAPGTNHVFALALVPANLAGFLLDRTWGILPHAPLYAIVMGALVAGARMTPLSTLFLVAVWLALAVPSAGHGLNAGGGSPARHLVAVMPLMVLPGAALVRRQAPRWAIALSLVAVLVSLQQATAYDTWHVKHLGEMHDRSASGWKPNLLFPDIAAGGLPAAASLVWIALVPLIAAGVVSARRGRQFTPSARALLPAVARASAVALVACVALTAWSGRMFDAAYAMSPREARNAVLQAYLAEGRCRLCLSLERGRLGPETLTWNGLSSFRVEQDPTSDPYEPEVVVRALATPHDPALGILRLEFGDGDITAATLVAGGMRVRHRYPGPGTYLATAHFQLPDGERRTASAEIVIR